MLKFYTPHGWRFKPRRDTILADRQIDERRDTRKNDIWSHIQR
jgi:hypothetical protein